MDLYVVSLAAGATGLGAMAISGLAHVGGGGHSAHGGHDAHGGHGGHAAHGGHDAHGGHTAHGGRDAHAGHDAHGAHHHHAGDQGSRLQSLLSPRVLFSLLVGFGAGGMLAERLGEPWQLGAAVLGAIVFEAVLVGPLWRFLFRFESRAAVTLESSIEDEARAVTSFDANGCGLVALDVDGQVVQLLATLTDDERAHGVRVRSGDLVRISEVDPSNGRCIVRTSVR